MINLCLFAKSEKILFGAGEMQKSSIRLRFRNHEGADDECTLADLGGYLPVRLAERVLPEVLRNEARYWDEVDSAVDELKARPKTAYKVMEIKNGALRSVFLDRIAYCIGELYAHPVIPDFRIGLRVHPSIDAARQHAQRILYGAERYAIVECATAEISRVDHECVTAAFVPIRVAETKMLYTARVAYDKTARSVSLERWNPESMCWTKERDTTYADAIAGRRFAFIEPDGKSVYYYLAE